ncbi:DNA-processing protein DprA [Enterococcus sp. MJM12]|uniref:DNA-processing protein DprA n=1 Tax=Candidatus Enterococcus myersii TaxID=2815322 RepID=A0ABS3HBU3_9ENTE|nr:MULTISPECIES: DNA-processing protein DprA [Enterococcus]MBO0450434.1 DNA-processing protein DprA [Enterococcus sp. MJM12]MDT2740798.1 DNA-processing protein DprA [Enterococcus canintestini]WHA10250.1 DNA-processing protein DprA [Enterococcus montenegrensis]
MEREWFLLKLALLQGAGIITKWRILEYAQKHQYFNFTAKEVQPLLSRKCDSFVFYNDWNFLTQEVLQQKLNGQKYVTLDSPLYPKRLKEIYQPPFALFYEGNILLLQQEKIIGFVGSRNVSPYGKEIVKKFVPPLTNRGYTIASGLAKGVDSCSHLTAMQSFGQTIGVVGCGLDICYPKEVFTIYWEMLKNQLVISEYPYGTPVRKYHFPMRNRIIAGISQAVCVVEAKAKSGSLTTAQLALDTGKEVFAFPGDILNGRSTGCLQLIQDGAKCVISLKDILEELPNFE